MMKADVLIPMQDSAARAFVFTPDRGSGPWPSVLFYMDACGVRPAMFEMCERLATAGYFVLLPDAFWRAAPYPPIDAPKLFSGDEERWALVNQLRATIGPARQVEDARTWLDWLCAQPQASADKVGVTGYCMGGAMALRVAGTFPDRVVAAASFHGGHLATDEDTSPHLLAPNMRAKILVAGADDDRHFDKAQCERLDRAFAAAGIDATVSIWKGLSHGWTPSDMPVHDPKGAERHWRELFNLLDTLKYEQ